MEVVEHVLSSSQRVAQLKTDEVIVRTADEGKQLLADLYYQGFECIILHESTLAPSFFDLKSGLAGEVLQKVSNFRLRLAIVGSFESYQSESMRAFIAESNRVGRVLFVPSVEEALAYFIHQTNRNS